MQADDVPLPHYVNFANFFQVGKKCVGVHPPPPPPPTPGTIAISRNSTKWHIDIQTLHQNCSLSVLCATNNSN